VTVPPPPPFGATVSRYVDFSNRAVTDRAEIIVTVHVGVVPLQEPDHPVNSEDAPGAAVNVTIDPFAPCWAQSAVQLPEGLLTVPEPGPVNVTLIGYVDGSSIAVTVRSPSIVTLQAPVPLQEPPHRWNSELASAAAESVTVDPYGTSTAHPAPAVPPVTTHGPSPPPVTVPPPPPFGATVSRYVDFSNRAVTRRAELIVTVHVGVVPLQEPDHPVKSDVAPGAAVNVTVDPFAPCWAQSAVQLPEGLLTVPEPGPVNVTLIG
jgi:hypothetical protein